MYVLKVITEEYFTDEKFARSRFNTLRKHILNKETCIISLRLVNHETGEIINEYKRLH